MQVFPRETTDNIAEQLGEYFKRKEKKKMTFEDAKALIDFVSGPAPMPSDSIVPDVKKPHVSGGGVTRPTEHQIETIVSRYEDAALWDRVVDDLIKQCDREPVAIKIIHMAFRDGEKECEICEKLHISRQTFYNYRLTILVRGAILAHLQGL